MFWFFKQAARTLVRKKVQKFPENRKNSVFRLLWKHQKSQYFQKKFHVLRTMPQNVKFYSPCCSDNQQNHSKSSRMNVKKTQKKLFIIQEVKLNAFHNQQRCNFVWVLYGKANLGVVWLVFCIDVQNRGNLGINWKVQKRLAILTKNQKNLSFSVLRGISPNR